MTWGESACLIYRWPCLKALQTPTERPVGVRRKGERRGTEGGWGKLNEERFQGCTFPVAEQRKCMVMHYLARAVLVLSIKEHGWLNTAACTEKSWRDSLNDAATSFSLQAYLQRIFCEYSTVLWNCWEVLPANYFTHLKPFFFFFSPSIDILRSIHLFLHHYPTSCSCLH